MRILLSIIAILWGIFNGASVTANQSIPDQYEGSLLYSKPTKVAEGVWSAIGQTGPPTYENAGHNNNLSFIITSDGVLVVNGGASYMLAEALHAEIKALTDQPVKYVVNENGQGHAMLGNSYWVKQAGVIIIAHVDAHAEFEEFGYDVIDRMQTYNKDRAEGSNVTLPTETFEGTKDITMGDTEIKLISFGPAHSPGDISVWLPQKSVVIAGDMAFHQRMLPVFENTDTAGWLVSWEGFAALGAKTVVPGHGIPTTMDVVTTFTRDYLTFIRGKVGALIDDGGSLQDAYDIDQSVYADLDTYKELAVKNAERVYRQMEFE